MSSSTELTEESSMDSGRRIFWITACGSCSLAAISISCLENLRSASEEACVTDFASPEQSGFLVNRSPATEPCFVEQISLIVSKKSPTSDTYISQSAVTSPCSLTCGPLSLSSYIFTLFSNGFLGVLKVVFKSAFSGATISTLLSDAVVASESSEESSTAIFFFF